MPERKGGAPVTSFKIADCELSCEAAITCCRAGVTSSCLIADDYEAYAERRKRDEEAAKVPRLNYMYDSSVRALTALCRPLSLSSIQKD